MFRYFDEGSVRMRRAFCGGHAWMIKVGNLFVGEKLCLGDFEIGKYNRSFVN